MKKRAFQKLLREHNNRIFSYAFYFLRNREDAEDVAQEVFLRLWQHWERVERKRMVAWMMRVTHNRCVDLIRQKRASVIRQKVSSEVNFESIRSQSDIHSDPELYHEFTETQNTLLTAMERLPEKTKHMLLLHYFQGLKYEEIGEILDMKIGTVKVTVHRGRRALRDLLEGHFPERGGKSENGYAMS